MFRTQWQDFEAWKGSGLPISSTSSVEAVKMYDAVVSQVSVVVIFKFKIKFIFCSFLAGTMSPQLTE